MSDRGSGLSGLAHSDSADEVVDRYDSWVADYETDVRSWGYTLPEQLTQHLVERTPFADLVDDQSVVVLDAGCGTGLVGNALKARGVARLIGIDVSSASVRTAAAQQIYAGFGVVDLNVGLPFASKSVAAVTCGGVLTYVPDTEAVLREFVRVLTDNGTAVVSQRTDLWSERDCDGVVARLRSDGLTVDVGDPQPYLPDLDEYGEQIQVRLVTLRR